MRVAYIIAKVEADNIDEAVEVAEVERGWLQDRHVVMAEVFTDIAVEELRRRL